MNRIDEKVKTDFEMMLNHQWLPPLSWFVSRVYWLEVATRLPQRPENIELGNRWITEVLPKGTHVCSKKYLLRWQEILNEGIEPVIEVLSSISDEEPQVLRSCAPSALSEGLILENERLELHQQVKNQREKLIQSLELVNHNR